MELDPRLTHVYVFRRDGTAILEMEWRAVIDSDATLTPIDELHGRNPATAELVRIATIAARWSGPELQAEALFRLENGEIIASWVGEKAIEKARELAGTLGADVRAVID